jgi:hypothetical protein
MEKKKKNTEEKRNVCEREKKEERKQTRSIIHSFIQTEIQKQNHEKGPNPYLPYICYHITHSS